MNPDINWAIRQKAPASCKHVLLVLANRADRNHSCYPSLTRISSDTGLDRSTVTRCITQLLDMGLLLREKRGIQTNIYRLPVGAPRNQVVVAPRNQEQVQDAPSCTTPLVAPRHQGRRTTPPKVVAPRATEPKVEPKGTQKGDRDVPAGLGEFHSVVLSETQSAKLHAKFNGNFQRYLDRLDRYSQTHPKEFKKYESHYAVLLSWYDRDIAEGKLKPEIPGTNGHYTTEEIAEATERLRKGGVRI